MNFSNNNDIASSILENILNSNNIKDKNIHKKSDFTDKLKLFIKNNFTLNNILDEYKTSVLNGQTDQDNQLFYLIQILAIFNTGIELSLFEH